MKTWKDCNSQLEANAVTLSFTDEEAARLASLLVIVAEGASGEDAELVEATIAELHETH